MRVLTTAPDPSGPRSSRAGVGREPAVLTTLFVPDPPVDRLRDASVARGGHLPARAALARA